MERVIAMSEKELTRLEIMQRLESGQMKQSQAAENLGISVRQVKRLLKAYKGKELKGSFPGNEEPEATTSCLRKSKTELWSSSRKNTLILALRLPRRS